MEKRPTNPKAGTPSAGKAPARPPKPVVEDDATQVAADGSVAPVNAEDQAPAPTEAFSLRSDETSGDESDYEISEEAPEEDEPAPESPPAGKQPRTAPNLEATRAHAEEAPSPKPAAKPKPPAAAPPSPARTNMLGDFRLLKKLGEGGMGAVYKAHQVSLDREVAIKVLSKELASKPAFVQRFLREARVMARLDHPNILRCFEVKAAHGLHYIAMEFIDGGSIDGWLKKLGRFDLGDALHVTIACARALEHAHEQGMIHRDVKPDNILLTRKGVIKVADLGLAKATDDDLSLTRTGTGAGTPIFMAPEQARDVKHVDGRCDIYALGVMLYCFLTGEAPFKGETLVELIEAKEKGKFPPARRANDEVPDRLDLIIDKMLAAKPDQRYRSCTELLEDLEELGLASERLSFIEVDEAAAGKSAARLARPAAKAAPQKATPPKAAAEPAAKQEAGIWYASFKNAQGKEITKKLSEGEVLAAIKSGGFSADTQLSRTLKGGYRALATYPEFEPSLRAHMTKAKADKKGEKYRKLYKQIEEEDARRRRWRWLRRLYERAGGMVGFLIGVAVILALIAGVGYLIYSLIINVGENIPTKK